MMVYVGLEELDRRFAALEGAVPDTAAYNEFCAMILAPDQVRGLSGQDPFAEAYRAGALALYQTLANRAAPYDPGRDERSGLAPQQLPDVWTALPPWSFRDPRMLAEFLESWGQIARLLEPRGGAQRIIEYGCGTGQLLILLARAGQQVFGVDIDAGSLDAVRLQAEALGLRIALEQAAFGEGFGEERFDVIVFFESFHHAWDFPALLRRLHERLLPGGRVILCGEPIVADDFPGVPFPWGPRLDALSIFCMRQFGWMELGFRESFLVEACRRAGWRVARHDHPRSGRATAWVLEPATEPLLPGRSRALGAASGWSEPEGDWRWTFGGTATVSLPGEAEDRFLVGLRVGNYLPVPVTLTIDAGAATKRLTLAPGTVGRDVVVAAVGNGVLRLTTQGVRPADVVPGSADQRLLGVAVLSIEFLMDATEPPPDDAPDPPALPEPASRVPLPSAFRRWIARRR